tara:strand:- start:1293 stop:1970 length:678 start_codon:yes stop_codon:yes gene_type:complete
LQVIENHVPSFPYLADVLVAQLDLWPCFGTVGGFIIQIRTYRRLVSFLAEGLAHGGMDHGDQNALGAVLYAFDGRDKAAVGNDQLFIGHKTKGQGHIIETLFPKCLPFLLPCGFRCFCQKVCKRFLYDGTMQFGKDGTGLLVDHLDPTVIVQQKAHLYQVFSSALGADKALVVKGFLYFLCQHVEHDGQSLDVVVLVRGVQTVKEIAAGHFHEHVLDLLHSVICS